MSAGNDRSITVGRDATGSTIISGNGNIVVLQAAGLVRHGLQDQLSVDAEIAPNPYMGLLAFHEEDADRFFGRENQISRLWGKLRDLQQQSMSKPGHPRLLPILGPSGSGKSSLVRAGLIAELAREPLPGWKKAQVAVLTPGAHPVEALAGVLARIATGDATAIDKIEEFDRALKRKSDARQYEGLRRIADALPEIASVPLLLLVDQFEEIYSLCNDKEERTAFIENLLTAASDAAGRVSVVLTLRTDFLGETQTHKVLNHLICEQQVMVPAMNEDELRAAISKPAELAGHRLDDATVTLLISKAMDREGALPLLQFALTRIWDGLTRGIAPAETYQMIGGLGGALAGEAERIYDGLSDTEKRIARRVFLGLVQLGEGTSDTRRRATVEDLVSANDDISDVECVIRGFATPGVRLLTVSATLEGSETVEITHEALLDNWERLNEWLKASRDDLRFHRRLTDAAHRWEKLQRPEGSRWRSPDLELLRGFRERAGDDMTSLEQEFFNACEAGERERLAEQQRTQRLESDKRVFQRTAWIAITLGLAILVSFLVALRGWRSEKELRKEKEELVAEKDQALIAKDAAVAEANLQRQRARAALLALEAANAVDPELAVLLALESTRLDPSPANVQTLREAATILARPWATFDVKREIKCFSCTPDARYVAVGLDDSTMRVWDVLAKEEIKSWQAKSPGGLDVYDIVLSPNGTFLASLNHDKSVRVWELPNGAEIEAMSYLGPRPVLPAFSKDGRHLAICQDKVVVLWDMTSRTEVRRFEAEQSPTAIKIDPNDDYLVGIASSSVRVWDLKTGETVLDIPAPSIRDVVLKDRNLLTVFTAGNATSWNLATAEQVASVEGHNSLISHSPDGNRVAVYRRDTNAALSDEPPVVEVLDADLTTVFARLHHDQQVTSMASAGLYVITADVEGVTRVWNTRNDRMVAHFIHERGLKHVGISQDGSIAITVGHDRNVRIWKALEGFGLNPITLKWESVIRGLFQHPLSFSPDGKYLGIAHRDGGEVIDVALRQIAVRWEEVGGVRPIAFSSDSKNAAICVGNDHIRIYDLGRRAQLDELDVSLGRPAVMALSPDATRVTVLSLRHGEHGIFDTQGGHHPLALGAGVSIDACNTGISSDGRWLATVIDDWESRIDPRYRANVWDLSNHEAVSFALNIDFSGDDPQLIHVAISDDGQRLAVVFTDHSTRVLDVKTGKELLQFRHRHGLRATFSRDGSYLALAGDMWGSTRVWDLRDGTLRARLSDPEEVIYAGFTYPDFALLTVGLEGRVVRHALDTEKLRADAESRLTRRLTEAEWKQYLGGELYLEVR